MFDSDEVPECDPDNRLSDVSLILQLEGPEQVIHWESIDDYAGKVLEEEGATSSYCQKTARSVRGAFQRVGWKIHKEAQGPSFMSSGMEIDLRGKYVRCSMALLWLAIEAIRFALGMEVISCEQVESVGGTWIWIALIQRSAFSVFFEVY